MEKIESVFEKLSNLYEFNRFLKTYKIKLPKKIKGQADMATKRKERGVLGKSGTLKN